MADRNGSTFALTQKDVMNTCSVCCKAKPNTESQITRTTSLLSPDTESESDKKNSSFTFKLHNFKNIFDGNRNGYSQCCPSSSSDCIEKKGLVQRMHSLSLLKSKERLNNISSEVVDLCTCEENGDIWYHTWPERGKDKLKSPKKSAHESPPNKEITDNAFSGPVHVDVLLNQLPLAYDPVTKQLRLLKSKPSVESTEEDLSSKKETGHKRQPSVLSNISNGSEAHLPLMTLHSNPQSYSSLSSLSNYSSSTDFTEQTNSLERSCQPPRFGLASFWQRTFARKSDSEHSNHSSSTQSWKLFSRGSFFQRQSQGGAHSVYSSRSSINSGSSPTATLRHVGSSGLILESRPSHLPAKCPEEELHHQLLHQKLFEEAQKREKIKTQEAEKLKEEACKLEEQIAQATKIWTAEILPQWDVARKWRKTRDLWWQGLPPSIRGQVWKLAIGNDLNVTPELFGICLERAKERKLDRSNGIGVGLEASADVIKLDLSRTFPHLGIFQQGGPFYGALDDLLSAYVCFRPDIGYVQGMSFVAATLLLNLDVADAFVSFANLLNRPLLHAFFRLDQPKMAEFYSAFDALFKSHLPKLHSHLNSLNLTPDLYLQEWIYTLYSRTLPIDLASRVWDLYCRDGEDFIFRTAVGILKLYESTLLEMDFIHAAQFLTNLPEDLNAIKLFKAIDQVHVSTEKSRFSQILTHHLSKVKGGHS